MAMLVYLRLVERERRWLSCGSVLRVLLCSSLCAVAMARCCGGMGDVYQGDNIAVPVPVPEPLLLLTATSTSTAAEGTEILGSVRLLLRARNGNRTRRASHAWRHLPGPQLRIVAHYFPLYSTLRQDVSRVNIPPLSHISSSPLGLCLTHYTPCDQPPHHSHHAAYVHFHVCACLTIPLLTFTKAIYTADDASDASDGIEDVIPAKRSAKPADEEMDNDDDDEVAEPDNDDQEAALEGEDDKEAENDDDEEEDGSEVDEYTVEKIIKHAFSEDVCQPHCALHPEC